MSFVSHSKQKKCKMLKQFIFPLLIGKRAIKIKTKKKKELLLSVVAREYESSDDRFDAA